MTTSKNISPEIAFALRIGRGLDAKSPEGAESGPTELTPPSNDPEKFRDLIISAKRGGPTGSNR
jgi:hypothetical protein